MSKFNDIYDNVEQNIFTNISTFLAIAKKIKNPKMSTSTFIGK